MIMTILSTTVPIIITLLLGFVAAWHHDFSSKDAPILNRMVLTYAVPMSIFAGTVSTSKLYLLESVPLLLTITVTIIGLCAIAGKFSDAWATDPCTIWSDGDRLSVADLSVRDVIDDI